MTEDEAKTKWCPYIALTLMSDDDRNYHVTNRFEDVRSDRSTNCIASACMAWRETFRAHDIPGNTGDPILVPTGGFCGLAGKP